MKKKVLYITGSRADYGLMLSVLNSIHQSSQLSLHVIITGMHVMQEFGMTANEISKSEFQSQILSCQYEKDNKESMATFIGQFVQQLAPVVNEIKPYYILLLGDRGEMLAGAIVGAYMGIKVVHMHGGEITSTVDDLARNAITKLADIHMPATNMSRENILKMGEDSKRIFMVGAPGLDYLKRIKLPSRNELSEKYGLDFSKTVLMVLQHPVSSEEKDNAKHMKETMEAISFLNQQTVLVFPNSDAGGREMIDVIKNYESNPHIHLFKNIPHADYLGLLNNISALIGNSSSALIEAPSLGLPVVNIGTRQAGRERSSNVIDVGYEKTDIIRAIERATSDEAFIKMTRFCKNPYNGNNTSEMVVSILEKNNLDKKR